MADTEYIARNLEEAAEHFRVSIPVVRRWIAKGAPVVRRGGNGVPYEINLEAMATWRQARKAERERARAEFEEQRAARDRELQRELLGPTVETVDAGELTPAQREAAVRAELSRIRLARENGRLVPFDDIAFKVSRAVREFRDRLLVLPEQLGRRLGLDDATVDAIQIDVDAALEDAADAIAAMASAPTEPVGSTAGAGLGTMTDDDRMIGRAA